MAAPAPDAGQPGRALLVSLGFADPEATQKIGQEAYSYHFVYRAFAPLLQRWGRTVAVTRPESRLDYALWRARREGLRAVHLSFLPLHLAYLTEHAANVAFPFWEFPDLPGGRGDNPRHNWLRVSQRLDLILTASSFTRAAFVRAGVTTPVHVVPVPIAPDYFAVPPWQPGRRAVVSCPAYTFPAEPARSAPEANPWAVPDHCALGMKERVRKLYRRFVRPCLPGVVRTGLTLAVRGVAAARKAHARKVRVDYPARPALELEGVVYTTILNPFDERKNWQDLLSAFLLALGDRPDATLVVKLVVCPELAPCGLNDILDYYHQLGIPHRCKLALVAAYLSDAQMLELARASTYYVNTARAEGACLPLQNFLAGGRPGVAPAHTALGDYFHGGLGFVVDSHPEPAPNPLDPGRRSSTTWHRLVWQSLADQFRTSYEVARFGQGSYQALARRGREEMGAFAGIESVWPRLAAALDLVCPGAAAAPLRRAS
jgi:glycosyltransferase involved in cell wall biosynthesis